MRNKLSNYQRISININDDDIQYQWYESNSDELVAMIRLTKSNGITWVRLLFVSPKFRKQGLSYALLDFATTLGATHLKVDKCNDLALKVYKNYDFQIFDEDYKCYYMKLAGVDE